MPIHVACSAAFWRHSPRPQGPGKWHYSRPVDAQSTCFICIQALHCRTGKCKAALLWVHGFAHTLRPRLRQSAGAYVPDVLLRWFVCCVLLHLGFHRSQPMQSLVAPVMCSPQDATSFVQHVSSSIWRADCFWLRTSRHSVVSGILERVGLVWTSRAGVTRSSMCNDLCTHAFCLPHKPAHQCSVAHLACKYARADQALPSLQHLGSGF